MDILGLSRRSGFTLVEVLVSSAVLAMLLGMLAWATTFSLSTVGRAEAKIDQFAAARAGFDRLTATLSQATLNTYWDYDKPAEPTKYVRKSDLHFLLEAGPRGGHAVYFQAPLARGVQEGTAGLLNAVGYSVDFSENVWRPRPRVTQPRWRYRLMQGIQPSENLSVFNDPPTSTRWKTALGDPTQAAFPLAENVIAMVLWPRLPQSQDPQGTQLSPNFLYDSRAGTPVQSAQLPPEIQVTLIVIDEASASRMDLGNLPPTVISNALAGRFALAADFERDLAAVQNQLTAAGVNHLVLSSSVVLRESKWSTQ
jgi:uncharacterized protein (TIGR02599 family)